MIKRLRKMFTKPSLLFFSFNCFPWILVKRPSVNSEFESTLTSTYHFLLLLSLDILYECHLWAVFSIYTTISLHPILILSWHRMWVSNERMMMMNQWQNKFVLLLSLLTVFNQTVLHLESGSWLHFSDM